MADKKKVLIIDDDPDICESIKAILDGNGFEASTALSGKEGLAAFRRGNPDIVLCDMMMEDIDAGGQVTKIMRRERPATPVFLLSTIGDATASTVGLDAFGFSGVFQKPVNFDLLLTVIGRYAKAK